MKMATSFKAGAEPAVGKSLRSQITLLFLGGVLVFAGMIYAASTLLSRAESERKTESDVARSSGLANRLIRARGQALSTHARLLAELPTLESALRTRGDTKSFDALQTLAHEVGADGMVVTDSVGRRLATTGTARRLPASLDDDPAVRRALEGKSWSGTLVVGGRLMLVSTSPVPGHGKPLGTVTYYSEIGSGIATDIRDILGVDVAFLVGDTITGSSTRRHLPVIREFDRSIAAPVGQETFVLYRTDLPSVAASERASLLIARRDADFAGPYSEFSFAMFCALVLSSLGAIIVARALSHRIVEPLAGVVAAASTLREGGWPARFETVRSDEIGILQGAFNEMTAALQETQQKLLSRVVADPLTELDNHRHFKENLAQEISRVRVSAQPLSLILIDLDDFGRYNEIEGHSAGDRVLVTFAEILRGTAPDLALLSRHSGDAFAAILPLCTIDQAASVAESIRSGMESAFHGLTCSLGCAEVSPTACTPDTLFLAAELALESAKHLGRNCVSRFDKIPGADSSDPCQLAIYLQDASLATIQALAAAVDAKDHYTRGHSTRVAEYASDLCRFIRGSEQEIELVYRTGTLHDVGKIGVPDSILNKPGRLTPEERQVMEQHPALGEVIVRKVPQLAETLPGVRHHHERWDGRGYPDGIEGADIPRLARILAIADTFDAMTSDRPYRQGMPLEIAIEEIDKGAGTQFDPYFAKEFAKMMRARHQIRSASDAA